MPVYEYECRNQGHRFEVSQKVSEEPLKECKICQGPVDKLISLTSFQLKGTGWYVTDYRDRPKEKKEKTEEKSSESSPSGDAKTEGSKEGNKTEKGESSASKSSGQEG